MDTLGRFVVRPQDGGDLILGSMYKHQIGLLPGHIYEIREVLDELVLVDVGKAAIGMTQKDSKITPNWGWDANKILECGGNRYLLTEKEVESEQCSPQ